MADKHTQNKRRKLDDESALQIGDSDSSLEHGSSSEEELISL